MMVVLWSRRMITTTGSCTTVLRVSAKRNGKKDFLLKGKDDLLRLVLSFDVSNNPARNSASDQQEKKWDEMYAELFDFHAKHGNCIVTYNDESNNALAKWVSVQRVNYRKGSMGETRQQRLDELQFTWSIQDREPHQEES
jgi:hypothetical protein